MIDHHRRMDTAQRILLIGLLALLLAAPGMAAAWQAQEATPTTPAETGTPEAAVTLSPTPEGSAPEPTSPEHSPTQIVSDTPALEPATATAAVPSATAIMPTATDAAPVTAAPTMTAPTTAPPPTPAPTLELTPTIAITPTLELTPTPILPEVSLPLTTTVTPPPFSPFTYLPLVIKFPPYEPTQGVLYCAPLGAAISIPDNQPGGVNSSMVLTDERVIADLDIRVTIDHPWIGDLAATLSHQQSGLSASLFDRPGYPASQYGCEGDNVRAVFNDEMDSSAENVCASSPAGLPGSFEPRTPLETFSGMPIQGTWTLNVSDNYPNDTGKITSWCLFAQLSPNPEPTPAPPPPPSLPSQVILSGVTGKPQALPLDCESRSAVDWAKYFGVTINELTFFNQLPHSDNPDKGFVGNVYGTWGQIPPDDYGVHAEPIAALLRDYGLPAYARRPLGWDWLRAEIAAGRPVIVWITGNVEYGIPVFYTPASDGLTTLVARYEHVVVVTGYSNSSVYYLNGSTIYTRSIPQFLASWSTMGYVAVAATP